MERRKKRHQVHQKKEERSPSEWSSRSIHTSSKKTKKKTELTPGFIDFRLSSSQTHTLLSHTPHVFIPKDPYLYQRRTILTNKRTHLHFEHRAGADANPLQSPARRKHKAMSPYCVLSVLISWLRLAARSVCMLCFNCIRILLLFCQLTYLTSFFFSSSSFFKRYFALICVAYFTTALKATCTYIQYITVDVQVNEVSLAPSGLMWGPGCIQRHLARQTSSFGSPFLNKCSQEPPTMLLRGHLIDRPDSDGALSWSP